MPKKQNVDNLLRKNLGKERATRVMHKIKKMLKAGASPVKIQKVIAADVAAEDAVILLRVVEATGTGVRGGVLTPGVKK